MLLGELCSYAEYSRQLAMLESVASEEEAGQAPTKSLPAKAMDCNQGGNQDAACQSQKTQTNDDLGEEKVEGPSTDGKETDPALFGGLWQNNGSKRPRITDDDGRSGVTGTEKASKRAAGPG